MEAEKPNHQPNKSMGGFKGGKRKCHFERTQKTGAVQKNSTNGVQEADVQAVNQDLFNYSTSKAATQKPTNAELEAKVKKAGQEVEMMKHQFKTDIKMLEAKRKQALKWKNTALAA